MKYDVVIVGGGGAGLTTAAYTAREGLSVALLDKQDKPGGLLQSVNRNGFIFDMGLRAIEDSGIILPMLADLNLSMKYVKSRVSLGIEDQIISIYSKDSLEDYKELLDTFYPESRDDIKKIMKFIRMIMKDMDVIYGIENPLFKELGKDYNYIFKTLLPWLFKFIFTIGKINRLDMPVEDFLDNMSSDPALKSIIGQHFFKQTPTFFAMSYFSVYLDYLYPEGGTASITQILSDYAQAKGLSYFPGKTIVTVDPHKQTVTDSNGESYHYKKLVWCANLKALYSSVDIQKIPEPKLKEKISSRRAQLEKNLGGDSVFSLFLSVDETPEYFRKICEGHFFYSPDSLGLGELHTVKLKQLLENFNSFPDAKKRVKEYLEKFFSFNTFEISIPVLKDSSMAPENKTGLIISCLFDYSLTKRIYEDGWYEELKDFCSDYIIEVLSQSIFPGLETKIIDSFCSTPLSIEKYTGNSEGAITGWAFKSTDMPVVHKMQQVAKSVATPMPNIYKAGQWAYSPSGLPIAILTGKLAADRVLKELKAKHSY